MNPKARTKDLLLQAVGEELVVYDQEHQRAHRLNGTAALVYQHCDGETPLAELATLVANHLGVPEGEQLVLASLNQLGEANLLESPIAQAATGRSGDFLGGRSILKPVIDTVLAPTPAAAFSF